MRGSSVLASLKRWWQEPGRYDWLVALVVENGYGALTRLGVSLGCLAIGAWPILMVFSPQGVESEAGRTVSVSCGVLALVLAFRWILGWPTRQQSTAIVVGLNLSIAISCVPYVAEGKPVVGSLAFALTASYVACVHALPQLLAVVMLASSVIIAGAVNAFLEGDAAGGIADGLLRLTSVTVVPMTARTLVNLLADSAVVSDIDPLTGLANRRGLLRGVRQLLADATATSPTRLSVTMIDIDDFKAINDTRGHAAGDDVLVKLARTLYDSSHDDAVVARIGGEEFVIVAACDTGAAVDVAERLRIAVGGEDSDMTASFGVASLTRQRRDDAIQLTESLLAAADEAMYLAKRAGGNRIEVSGATPV